MGLLSENYELRSELIRVPVNISFGRVDEQDMLDSAAGISGPVETWKHLHTSKVKNEKVRA